MMVHWTRNGSEACLGDGNCPAALHKVRGDFYAYAPVEQWDQPRQVWIPDVLEATAHLEEVLRGRKLRGETWILKRVGKKKRSDPVAGIFLERVAPDQLPEPFNILPVLVRRYRTDQFALDVANPLPPKVILPPSSGPAPSMLPELEDLQPSDPTPEDNLAAKEMLAEFLKTFVRPVGGASRESDKASRDFANQHRGNGRH
jgi:hypothetical protein